MLEKTIFITGISRGLGLQLATVFASNGYQVFGTVRTQKDVDRVHAQLGSSVQAYVADVRNYGQLKHAARRLNQDLKGRRLDVLYLNAGVANNVPFFEMDELEIAETLDVNVKGCMYTLRLFAPLMMRSSSGGVRAKVFAAGSIVRQMNDALMSVYTASKHAMYGLFQSLSLEFMLYDIDMVYLEIGYHFESREALQTLLERSYGNRDFYWFKGLETSMPNQLDAICGMMGMPEEVAKMALDISEMPKAQSHYVVANEKQQGMLGYLSTLSDDARMDMHKKAHGWSAERLQRIQDGALYTKVIIEVADDKEK